MLANSFLLSLALLLDPMVLLLPDHFILFLLLFFELGVFVFVFFSSSFCKCFNFFCLLYRADECGPVGHFWLLCDWISVIVLICCYFAKRIRGICFMIGIKPVISQKWCHIYSQNDHIIMKTTRHCCCIKISSCKICLYII